jgi:hypothetical protein
MATNDLLVGYTRRFSGPVDDSTVFSSYSALAAYAIGNSAAYAGMILVDSSTGNAYVRKSEGSVTSISGTASLAAVATSGAYSDLNGKPSIPVLLCPFDPRSSLTFSYDGSGNITTLTYTYGGATQGFADFAYSSGNLSTITYKGPDHTIVLRTITFAYSGTNILGYTVS